MVCVRGWGDVCEGLGWYVGGAGVVCVRGWRGVCEGLGCWLHIYLLILYDC